jgi:hypothetical protein
MVITSITEAECRRPPITLPAGPRYLAQNSWQDCDGGEYRHDPRDVRDNRVYGEIPVRPEIFGYVKIIPVLNGCWVILNPLEIYGDDLR